MVISEPEVTTVEVDSRDQYGEFDQHYRRCMTCATAPTGRQLCPEGAALFDAAMGRVGLDPQPNAITIDLSALSVSDLVDLMRCSEFDGVQPWAGQVFDVRTRTTGDTARRRIASRFRHVNDLVLAGYFTDWPTP
jgi:hypothetical protein